MGKLPFLFQGIKTSEFSAKRGRSRYSCPLPRRITGTCFIFFAHRLPFQSKDHIAGALKKANVLLQ